MTFKTKILIAKLGYKEGLFTEAEMWDRVLEAGEEEEEKCLALEKELDEKVAKIVELTEIIFGERRLPQGAKR